MNLSVSEHVETARIEVSRGVELAVDIWRQSDIGLLLVHGLASNARLWDGVATHLHATGHGVAAVDLRGHGRSSKPDSGYETETVAADLAKVLEWLAAECGEGWRLPVIVGQSWGANVAVELGWSRPALVRGIVCVDGGAIELARRFESWEVCARVLAPPNLMGTPLKDIEKMLRQSHPDWPDLGIAGVLGNFEVRPDGTVAPWLSYEHHMQILAGMWSQRPSDRWAAIQLPILFVAADTGPPELRAQKDQELTSALADLSKSRVHWFFQADHDIHAQFPSQLGQLIQEEMEEGLFS